MLLDFTLYSTRHTSHLVTHQP